MGLSRMRLMITHELTNRVSLILGKPNMCSGYFANKSSVKSSHCLRRLGQRQYCQPADLRMRYTKEFRKNFCTEGPENQLYQ